MRFGDIFRAKTKADPAKLSLHQIEEKAIKGKTKLVKYASRVVSARGNVFKNSQIDIDSAFDKRLSAN